MSLEVSRIARYFTPILQRCHRVVSNSSIAELLARHGLELARHLRRMVRDDDAAQDLLQDTMLRAHRSLNRLGPGANERAWLYRIATNAALNHLRGRGRERRAMERHAREIDVDQPVATGDNDADMTKLWQKVATLPERQRVALTLRVADELDYDEIAERMGCSEATARANVYQATKKLRLAGAAPAARVGAAPVAARRRSR
jgi:RNA polymerase sigma-70 factor (ECF subfamily)